MQNTIDEIPIIKTLLEEYAGSVQAEVIWMSVARAIGLLSEAKRLDPKEAILLARAYIDDGATSDLIDKLRYAQEVLLGAIPADDGEQYFVFSRKQVGGAMSFWGVYLMSTRFSVLGVYRTDISGFFSKKLSITAVTESKSTKVIRCSRIRDIRFRGNLENLVSSLMAAGSFHRAFPPEAVPAFCLKHWWLPLQRWLHDGV